MIDTQIQFELVLRKNTYKRSGKEYALQARFVGHNSWTLYTWENKPTPEEIQKTQKIILRACEFYHRHLYIPAFQLSVVDQCTKASQTE